MKFKYVLPPKLYRVLIEIKYHKRQKKEDFYLKKVSKFKNIHQGERCFILGNGPSLNKVNFSLLKNEVTFSVNQLPRNEKYHELTPTYHMWADRLFFELNDDDPGDMELLDVMKAVNTPNNYPVVFYEITALPMIKKYHLEDEINIEYFKLVSMNLDIMMRNQLDFTHSIPNMPTVVHTAICLAVYMGFSEIYLLGCDCTGFINIAKNKMAQGKEVVYGYSVSDNERQRMKKVSNQRTIKDELKSFVELFDLYDSLYKYCKKNGVELFNATEGGLLESIPRVNLEDVLS